MNPSMNFLDGNYDFDQPLGYSVEPYSQLNDTWSFDFNYPFDSTYDNGYIDNSFMTCNPADTTALTAFDLEEWIDFPTDCSGILAPPVPTQLMSPIVSATIPALLVPSTPKRPSVNVAVASLSNTGILSPPPSERPVRTRRHDTFDELCQLSNLGLVTPQSKKPTTMSAPVFATPLLPPSHVPETPIAHLSPEVHYISPSPSCYASSSSSATVSPIDSPSSSVSDSFHSPLSPPKTPVRRPAATRSGVGRSRSGKAKDEKPYSHPYGVPTRSGESERPYGCRHPGNIVPGDLPCDKNFARMHDWVRHQRVHTGQTPYMCLSCNREFKRSDARGRHWDGKSSCETYHTSRIREQLFRGEITADHPDVPILRRRAQKAEYRQRNDRASVPVQDLEVTMQHEEILGLGF
ncbi:unnamed protein product [Rhizoctonia solani]|uniref:C2H2-type domain-containing protein n=1 Tax=Rhizoctonia solani TaxID=456999 RepID=A0A8H3E802_9AGAM|nr:unnamed protein product [Rhizoctonia solani]